MTIHLIGHLLLGNCYTLLAMSTPIPLCNHCSHLPLIGHEYFLGLTIIITRSFFLCSHQLHLTQNFCPLNIFSSNLMLCLTSYQVYPHRYLHLFCLLTYLCFLLNISVFCSMASSDLSFVNCATFMDDEAACQIDKEQGSSVHNVLRNIQTYHMEYDSHCAFEKLPRCFFRDFGDLIHEYVVLRDPNKNEIEVQLVERGNELYFSRGWSRIREVYNLLFGGWIDFVYVNPRLLDISIRTRSGCMVDYPVHNPPLKYMLSPSTGQLSQPLSAMHRSSNGHVIPRSFVRCYLKTLTAYDIQSGTLVLPWYQFGQSAFQFTFSELILVDHAGCRYPCRIRFGVDRDGNLSCNIWGGWTELCRRHRLAEGDRVRFAVSQPERHYSLYVCIYPQIGIETTLSYPLDDGTYVPLYISQQYFVANC